MERYDSYKDSGVEWIGEIPSHWSKIKLSMTINTTQGIQVDVPKQRYVKEEGYERFLRISDYTNPNIEHRFVNVPNLINYMVNEDDIVMFRYGESGKVVKGLKGVICNNVFSISSKKHEMSNNYLFKVFSSNDFYELLKSSSNNPTLSQVSHSQIKEQKVPFPPLSEQQEIVSFLDTKTSLIDSLIEKTQRKIELLKEKRTSLINEVVTKGLNPNVEMKNSGVEWIGEIPSGWENGRLGYYSSVFRGSGYQYLNQVDEDYEGGKERVVRISDITEFNPMWCEYQKQFENYRIQPDNILIGGTGHYFGKSIYVTKEMEGLIHSYNIIRVVIKNQYPKYIQYWLSSFKIREQMDISVLGSGQPFIDIQGLKDLHILIPPLSEQHQIVEYLDEQTGLIDKTISIEEKRIELLKEYRQSLISEVVTGKRKVV